MNEKECRIYNLAFRRGVCSVYANVISALKSDRTKVEIYTYFKCQLNSLRDELKAIENTGGETK